jgi:hypothetical protein
MMAQLIRILIKRLEEKGIEPCTLHGFLRDLAHSGLLNPDVSLLHVNQRLHVLGWESVEMDDHTLQLAIAWFEEEGLKGLDDKPSPGFDINGKPHDVRGKG